jgi:signal transduction histidine kinase
VEVTHIAGPRHADGSQRVYAFGIDITERKRAQLALAAALAEAERANRPSRSSCRACRTNCAPPERRAGLRPAAGQLQPMPADQRHQVDEILRGGRHLLALINDLLDLGRIEAGELEVVCEAWTPTPPSRLPGPDAPAGAGTRVTLHHRDGDSPPALAWADPKRLRQVLLNLLSNAIKYNQPRRARGGGKRRHRHVVEFRVRDTGPGLSPNSSSACSAPSNGWTPATAASTAPASAWR